jgi:hypothetical protein
MKNRQKKYSEAATPKVRSGKKGIFSVLRAAKKHRALTVYPQPFS